MTDDPAEILRLLPERWHAEFLDEHAAFLRRWRLQAVAFSGDDQQPVPGLADLRAARYEAETAAYGMKSLHLRMHLVRATQAEQSDMLREILRGMREDVQAIHSEHGAMLELQAEALRHVAETQAQHGQALAEILRRLPPLASEPGTAVPGEPSGHS